MKNKEEAIKPTIKQKKAFKIMLQKMMDKNPVTMGEILLEAGFSPSTARVPKLVTNSKGWQGLLDQIDDSKILNKLYEIALDDSDKRACLQAIDQIITIKNKKPKQDAKVIGLFEKVSDLQLNPDDKSNTAPEEDKLPTPQGTGGSPEMQE